MRKLKENKPNKIIVHHSVSARDTTTITQINRWHKDRGFLCSSLGYWVGYHYVIFADGTIQKVREHHEEGCHCIGQNTESLGVCIVGNFMNDAPTLAQKRSFGLLARDLCYGLRISPREIYGHREFSATLCPGRAITRDWITRSLELANFTSYQRFCLWMKTKKLPFLSWKK